MTENQNYAILALFENPQLWITFTDLAEMLGSKPNGGLASTLHFLAKKGFAELVRDEVSKVNSWRITEIGCEYVRENLATKVKRPIEIAEKQENSVNLKTLCTALKVLEARCANLEGRLLEREEWMAAIGDDIDNVTAKNRELTERCDVLEQERHSQFKHLNDLRRTQELQGVHLAETTEFAKTHHHPESSSMSTLINGAKKEGAKEINLQIKL